MGMDRFIRNAIIREKFIAEFRYIDMDGKPTKRRCECKLIEEEGMYNLHFRDMFKAFSGFQRGILNFEKYNKYTVEYEALGNGEKREIRIYYVNPVNATMQLHDNKMIMSMKAQVENLENLNKLLKQEKMDIKREVFNEANKDKREQREIEEAKHKAAVNKHNFAWKASHEQSTF